jgi:hypothetical protein
MKAAIHFIFSPVMILIIHLNLHLNSIFEVFLPLPSFREFISLFLIYHSDLFSVFVLRHHFFAQFKDNEFENQELIYYLLNQHLKFLFR